ncbi:MAG: hypothetical protein JJT99_07120 [Rhodobacteraceae bacterium]|nr:hypothetical protein [Paracoccaceae bacterium]
MQEPENLDSVLSEIRTALMDLEGQAKSGTQIYDLIMTTVPNLDIRSIVDVPAGPGALTKFLGTYFPEIRQIGWKGGDKLYGIGADVVAPKLVESPNIWKAFVSTNAVANLCLRTSDMRLFVSSTLDLEDGSHHIPHVTQDELDDIQQRFVTSLSDDTRAKLEAGISSDSTYADFMQAVRSNWLLKPWGEFRRDGLKQIFEGRLKKLPIPKNSIPAVVEQLLDSQRVLYRSEDKVPSRPSPSSAHQPVSATPRMEGQSLDSARSLAKSVIDKMGYDELRQVQLPFGAVLDALNIRK